MKQIIGFFLVAAIVTGCATKEEKARTNLSQVWRISKVLQNGVDVTDSYTSTRIQYRISFSNGGGFVESFYSFSGADQTTTTGSWFFSDGITKLSLNNSNQSRIYQVDLLEEEVFNITDLGSTNERQIEFVPE